MSFHKGREQSLPDIPVDINESAVENDEFWLIPSPKTTRPADTKILPSIKIENTLSEEEMIRLRELWNGAGLSARAHRRKHAGKHIRAPAPISIPVPGDVTPTLQSTDPPMTSTTPSTAGTQKRSLKALLSARPFFEKHITDKGAGALEVLRAIAQDRLKMKLRYAKSVPNLGDKPTASPKQVRFQPIKVMPGGVPMGEERIRPRTLPMPPSEDEAIPEEPIYPEYMDENAIYFTISCHGSQGGVQFQSITPVPSTPASADRPDSPLLHRRFSLDQLTFAAQQAKALGGMELAESLGCEGDEILHLIDELSTYLRLEL